MNPGARKPRPYWENSLFLGSAVVVFVSFIVFTVWGQDGLVDLYRLHQVRERVAQANRDLLQDNLFTLEEIEKLKTRHYIEQTSRSDLGLVRPNEIVFILDE